MKYNIINNKLYIGSDLFDLNEISNAYVKTIPIGYKKILVDEEIDYSTTKGFLGYVLLDNPLGLLGGVEVNQRYVKVSKEIIQLVITINDKNKIYNLGTYHTLDDHYNVCANEGNMICKAILSAIENDNKEVNNTIPVEENKEENIFIRALKWYINFILISTVLIFKGIWIVTVMSLKVCWWIIKISLFVLFWWMM